MLIYKLVVVGAEKREIELKRMVEMFIDSFSWIEMHRITLKREIDHIEKVPGGGAKVRRVIYHEVNEECPYLQLLNSLSEVEIYKSQIYSDATPMEYGNFFPFGVSFSHFFAISGLLLYIQALCF